MYIKLDKLASKGETANTVIRLMMACNDLTLTNSCLGRYIDENNMKNKYLNDGACMYFVRLQIGHLHEGLKVIKEISDNKQLNNFVNSCSRDSQAAFKRLCRYIPSGAKRSDFDKYFGRIRHNLVFHYHESGQWIEKALSERINIKKQISSPVDLDEVSKTRYELADQIMDSIVCRNLFEIPYSVDLIKNREPLDKILDLGAGIARDFVGFGGEFIHNFIERELSI